MDRSRKFDFAFDVDHSVLAGIYRGGDSGRAAEGVISEADDREAVDLPDNGAGGVDHERSVLVQLLHPLFNAVDAVEAFLRGGTDIITIDDGMPCLGSPEADFTDKIGDLHEL